MGGGNGPKAIVRTTTSASFAVFVQHSPAVVSAEFHSRSRMRIGLARRGSLAHSIVSTQLFGEFFVISSTLLRRAKLRTLCVSKEMKEQSRAIFRPRFHTRMSLSRMLRECPVVTEGHGAKFSEELRSKGAGLCRVHLGHGRTPGEVLQRIPRFSRAYTARTGDSERISVVYRCRTYRVMRGRGNGDPRIAVRSTLGPTPPGHRLTARVAEWTGQGETGHILHQR